MWLVTCPPLVLNGFKAVWNLEKWCSARFITLLKVPLSPCDLCHLVNCDLSTTCFEQPVWNLGKWCSAHFIMWHFITCDLVTCPCVTFSPCDLFTLSTTCFERLVWNLGNWCSAPCHLWPSYMSLCHLCHMLHVPLSPRNLSTTCFERLMWNLGNWCSAHSSPRNCFLPFAPLVHPPSQLQFTSPLLAISSNQIKINSISFYEFEKLKPFCMICMDQIYVQLVAFTCKPYETGAPPSEDSFTLWNLWTLWN